MLVMGPWSHGQWSGDAGDRLGNVRFVAKTGEFYRENIELPFLKQFLKDDTNGRAAGSVRVRNRHEPMAAVRAWPPQERAREDAVLSRRWTAGVRAAQQSTSSRSTNT